MNVTTIEVFAGVLGLLAGTGPILAAWVAERRERRDQEALASARQLVSVRD